MRTLSFILFLFFANKCVAQQSLFGGVQFDGRSIPVKSGKKFEKGYYHLPVKVVVKDRWKATEKEKKDIVETIREFGFRDTIILVMLPAYPNKAFRDSIDLMCNKVKVASVMEIFVESQIEYGKTVSLVKMNYKPYDYTTSAPINPGMMFSAGSLGSMKPIFNKYIPDSQ